MYYHIKFKDRNKDTTYFYDNDIDIAIAIKIKEQFYSESNIVCEGLIIKKK